MYLSMSCGVDPSCHNLIRLSVDLYEVGEVLSNREDREDLDSLGKVRKIRLGSTLTDVICAAYLDPLPAVFSLFVAFDLVLPTIRANI